MSAVVVEHDIDVLDDAGESIEIAVDLVGRVEEAVPTHEGQMLCRRR